MTNPPVERSSKWPAVMKAYLKKHPVCEACDESKNVNVHHIAPFDFVIHIGRPDLELDERNLITLCGSRHNAPEENHHLLLGHYGNFKHFNINVRQDAEQFKNMTKKQILESIEYQSEKEKYTMLNFDEMTKKQLKEAKAWVKKTYPKLKAAKTPPQKS
jgi:5-methylcytosine-specific restriction enzyme A